LSDSVESASKNFSDFLAFVKTFKADEFSTIYCEREWRSIRAFSFKPDDIAMIVLPQAGEESIFQRFIEVMVPALSLPRSLPIVPWEDLIEH
jgi:hypothetical protein